jgi:hypothetical protein
MRRFTVRPRTFANREALVGAQEDHQGEWVFIGRLAEAGQTVDINFDVSSEHVVSIFGKRGSGKSYTLGVLLEGLCAKEKETPLAHISRTRGVLLFDTLGIFQWFDVALRLDSGQEVIKRQLAARRGWNVQDVPLDAQIWIPLGTRKDTTPASHREFSINCSDFTASDWGYLLGLDIYQDRMGQLLNDAYIKTAWEGWSDGRRNHRPEPEYSVEQLIECIKNDTELLSTYQAETRRAVMQQLLTYHRNPLFQQHGTTLTELLRPGQLGIIVMNKLPDELRLLLMTALIRKVMQARVDASEDEKSLQILPNLSAEERQALQQRLANAIPPSWIVIDEAQNVLPSERKTSATEVLVKLVREGRNFGLSFMFTTQQPSAIDQRILSQVDTIIAHKLTVQTDIDYVRRNLKSNMPDEVKFANNVLAFDQLLRALETGQALVSNTETERAFVMDVRPRVSVHGGF